MMETTTKPTAANGITSCEPRDNTLAALSPDDQEQMFFDLLREIYRRNPGDAVIPLVSRNGEWLGNLVSPNQPAAAADKLFAQMPPQTREAIMKPLLDFDFDDTLSDDEVTNLLKPDSPA